MLTNDIHRLQSKKIREIREIRGKVFPALVLFSGVPPEAEH